MGRKLNLSAKTVQYSAGTLWGKKGDPTGGKKKISHIFDGYKCQQSAGKEKRKKVKTAGHP